MPTPPNIPTVRADGTPTDDALYSAAISAGLDAPAAAALIHARRGQATANQIFNAIPSHIDDATARSLTHLATGIPSGSPQATTPAAPLSAWDRAKIIAESPSSLLTTGAMLATADKSDLIAGADKAVNAAAFGQGHRVAAALQSLLHKGNLSDYRKNDDLYRASLDEDAQNHPSASLVGSTVGAVASPLNRLLAPLGAVGGGFTAGAIAGSGDAKDDLSSQIKGAGIGGVAGGVFGSVLQGLASRIGRDAPAASLAGHLAQADTPAASLAANPPSMLADALPGLTRTVRSAAPDIARPIDAALLARRQTQIPTIQTALEDGLGITRGDASAARDVIVANRAAAARPLYDAAYAGPDVSHPEIASAMKLPAFQQAYRKAQALAAIEGTPLPAPANASTMSVRGLDLLKRGLNDVVDAGMRGGTMARGEARALNQRLRTVLTATDTQAPAFATARKSFAGHSALLDAAENGASFLHPQTTAADISADLAALSPSEAQVYRTTAANALLNKVESFRGSASGKADLLSKVYDSVGGRNKILALFPTPEAGEAFDAQMQRLATENATYNHVTGGSQTTDKAAALKALTGSNILSGAAKVVGMAAHPMTAILHGGGAALGARETTAAARALAPELISSNVSALLQRLGAEQARQAAAQQAARAIAVRGGGLLGDALGNMYGNRTGDVR
jgi:hypothetical protein